MVTVVPPAWPWCIQGTDLGHLQYQQPCLGRKRGNSHLVVILPPGDICHV